MPAAPSLAEQVSSAARRRIAMQQPDASSQPTTALEPATSGEAPTPTRRLLIHAFLVARGPVDIVRIRQPNEFLETIPGVRTLVERDTADLNLGRPGEEKVFVWQRPILKHPGGLQTLAALLARGYLIVVEYDDCFYRRPEHAANRFLTFRGCHGVQTTTAVLADRIRQLNPNVAIFPNQIAHLPEPRTCADSEVVTIAFGALNREGDWAPILPALNEVLCRFGRRVRVKVIYDRRFFDALATDQKEFEPLCPYDRYLEILRSADVGLLPLEPTEMNVAKSDLKFVESAACGLAVLASPTVYQDSIADGRTGLIYRSAGEFRQKLTALIESPELRREIAGRAYQHVRDHRQLSQHFRRRYDWYLALRDSLPRLNAELAARVPELAGVLRRVAGV